MDKVTAALGEVNRLDYPTDYARTDQYEDFADSVSSYLLGGDPTRLQGRPDGLPMSLGRMQHISSALQTLAHPGWKEE